MFNLTGKKALITGGGSGIGFGIAQSFIRAGAEVVIVGRNEAALRSATRELGPRSTYEVFDINSLATIPDFVARIARQTGGIDILVNNAGRHFKGYAVDTTDAEFLAVMQTNLMAVFSLTREISRHMIGRRQGVILLISSMTAGVAMDKVVGYSTAKTALLGMMRTMAVEFAPFGVRINAIAPGWIQTDMLDQALANDPARRERILGRIPMSTFGVPEDIGAAAVFLAAPEARYITNVLLPVDGGAMQAL